jgi:broad specificity phosphatase PhoE
VSGEPDARAGASADPGASGGGVRELVLVRHAETAWSRSGRHTGATDVPLTDHGRQVASGLRERLSPYSFDVVLSSPLGRARETCELAGLADRVQLRAELAEWDYGDYEGLTTTQIHAQRPDW